MKKRIAILGSTGSIGTQALEVIRQHRDPFELVVLTAGRNADLLMEQASVLFLPTWLLPISQSMLMCAMHWQGFP